MGAMRRATTLGMLSESRRTRVAVGMAVLVHAAAFAGVVWRATSPKLRAEAPLEGVLEEEVALSLEPEAPGLPPRERETLPAASAMAERAAGSHVVGAVAASSETPSSAAASEAPSETPAPGPTAMIMMPASPDAIGIARGSNGNFFLQNGGVPDKKSADGARPVEDSLRHALRERDLDVGLGADGPVIRALEDAARSSTAPERGVAVFSVLLDAGGAVRDVRLVSAAGDGHGWADARDHAAKALLGTKLELRGAKIGDLRIEVSSDMRLPSGAHSAITPTLEPTVTSDIPDGLAMGSVRIARFDLADIGQKPKRIVHACVLRVAMQ